MKWIIQDWAGNHKFPNKTFRTFDDGIGFLDSVFPDDEERGEFYVVPA